MNQSEWEKRFDEKFVVEGYFGNKKFAICRLQSYTKDYPIIQDDQSVKENEYKCAVCGNVYEKGVTDEEAMVESTNIWGEIPESERKVICDDCFNRCTLEEVKQMGREYKNNQIVGLR